MSELRRKPTSPTSTSKTTLRQATRLLDIMRDLEAFPQSPSPTVRKIMDELGEVAIKDAILGIKHIIHDGTLAEASELIGLYGDNVRRLIKEAGRYSVER